MAKNNFLNKREIVIITIILFLAGVFYFIVDKPNGRTRAEIIYDGEIVMTVWLDEPQTFSLLQNENIIFNIENNSICFLSSDCPDKICVKTGYIKQNGRYAACLPNKAAVRVISDEMKTER